jgi:ribosomal protein S18 acetylase RimI-like enzyme
MSALEIRAARNRDTEEIVALWRAANLTVPHNDPYEDIRFCRDSRHGEVLVGLLGGTIVASVLVGHDGHRGWIYYVAVHPDHQGGGHGKTIVEAAEAWLTARGVPKVQLLIRETNTKVRAFYERLGYADEPRLIMTKRFIDHTGWEHGGNESERDRTAPSTGHRGIATTVTYLEMLERPTRPTVPAPSRPRVSLVRAQAPSVSFYRYLYDNVGGPWTWVQRRLMDDETLRAAITAPDVEVYVLWANGVPAGYGEVDRGIKPDEVELSYFGLMPDYIGMGLGWYFINTMIDIAWASEPNRVTVNTCDLDHPRAVGNYQKAGFKVFGQSVQHLPDPRAAGLPLPSHVKRHDPSAFEGMERAMTATDKVVRLKRP